MVSCCLSGCASPRPGHSVKQGTGSATSYQARLTLVRTTRRLAADAGAGAAADRGGGGPISKGARSAAVGCGCRVASAAASPGPEPDVGAHPGRGPRPAGAVLGYCGPALCKTWARMQGEARDQLVGGLSVSTTTMSSLALPQTSLACACPGTHWPAARAGQAAVCGSAQLGALSAAELQPSGISRDASALFSAHGTRIDSPILTTQKLELSLAGFLHSCVLVHAPGGPGVPLGNLAVEKHYYTPIQSLTCQTFFARRSWSRRRRALFIFHLC